jgi:WD40 repeat protein
MKCLEKDRTRRYETASNLARDVQRYLNDEPVEACPPSVAYRVSKYARRHKAGLAVAAGFLVLLLGGIVASACQAVRARNAESVALANERKALQAAELAKRLRNAESEQRRLAVEHEQIAVRERNSTLAAKEELRETLYASEMNLVQAAAESHQYAQAVQLLEQQRPAPGQSDLRGFEWHYWQRRLHRGRLRALDIPQLADPFESTSIGSRIFCRDGTRLVALTWPVEPGSAAVYGLLSVFDCSTGRELIAPFDPFPDKQDVQTRTPHVAVSDDGTRLATTLSRRVGDGRPAGHICLYDLSAGRELRRIESPGIVTELALTADGSRLAAAYLDQPASPANLQRSGGGNPAEVLRTREERVTREQAAVKVWDTSTGELIQTLPKLPWTFRSSRILWSPDGKRLLRQSVAKEIIDDKLTNRELFQVVEAASGEKVWEREFPNHAIPRLAWTWSPDGKLVVIFEVTESGIAAKHNAQLWDSDTGKPLAILDRENPSNGARPGTIDFSPDGRLLAIGSGANEIYIWKMPNLPPPDGSDPLHIAVPDLTLHTTDDDLHAVAFSADGRQLHSVAGKSLVTWDATLREDVGVGPESVGEFFISAISADSTKVAFSIASLRAPTSCVWDLTKNREVFRLPLGTAFSRPGFSADGRRVALVRATSASQNASEIVICDTQTGDALSTVRVDQNGLSSEISLTTPVLRPDAGQIAALLQPLRLRSLQEQAPVPARLIAWDTATGKQAFSAPIDATYAAGLVYSEDGSSLVVGTNSPGEMAAVFYNAATGERQRSVKMPGTPRSAVLILPRHQIFSNFVGLDALFLDLHTGQERFRLPSHHDLEDAAISPDGSRLAVGRRLALGGESEVTLWSLKTSRRLLALKRPGRMESIAFSPDGNRLVATFRQTIPGAAKPIQIWDATPLPDEVGR